MAVKHPEGYRLDLLEHAERLPGLDVLMTTVDKFLHWSAANSPWVFVMGTSCCAIELMAAAAGRLDGDRFGVVIRGSPRQADIMLVAGTITVKMAPRVKKLWDQMPEPKWCMAMGSCAISGDFYRDIYSVVPGVDTFIPVDVYVPGCPPNPEGVVDGVRRLQEKIMKQRAGTWVEPENRPETAKAVLPALKRFKDPERDPGLSQEQLEAVLNLDPGGALNRRLPVLGQSPSRRWDDPEEVGD
jgi:NADH-quinone oxidoreductase subunit B